MPLTLDADSQSTLHVPALRLYRDDIQALFERVHKVAGDAELHVTIRGKELRADSAEDLAGGRAPARVSGVRITTAGLPVTVDLTEFNLGDRSKITFGDNSMEARGLASELLETLRGHRRLVSGATALLVIGLLLVAGLWVAGALISSGFYMAMIPAVLLAAYGFTEAIPPGTLILTSTRSEHPSWWSEHGGELLLGSILAVITGLVGFALGKL